MQTLYCVLHYSMVSTIHVEYNNAKLVFRYKIFMFIFCVLSLAEWQFQLENGHIYGGCSSLHVYMYICMYLIQGNSKSYIKVILTSYHIHINTNIDIDINDLLPMNLGNTGKCLSFVCSTVIIYYIFILDTNNLLPILYGKYC